MVNNGQLRHKPPSASCTLLASITTFSLSLNIFLFRLLGTFRYSSCVDDVKSQLVYIFHKIKKLSVYSPLLLEDKEGYAMLNK